MIQTWSFPEVDTNRNKESEKEIERLKYSILLQKFISDIEIGLRMNTQV